MRGPYAMCGNSFPHEDCREPRQTEIAFALSNPSDYLWEGREGVREAPERFMTKGIACFARKCRK